VFPQINGAEEISKVVLQLSVKRIGALIAVEQEMSLEDYTKTGAVINAELNATLLLSLFYPGNPLHDGAVIIRKEDRCGVVSCPLRRSALLRPKDWEQGTVPAWD
jgi:DNA integrity scanning protein DisA with diadenylate cyclase activity